MAMKGQDQVRIKAWIPSLCSKPKRQIRQVRTWRVSGKLGILVQRCLSPSWPQLKSIQNCQVVPHVTKILQNFWLIKAYIHIYIYIYMEKGKRTKDIYLVKLIIYLFLLMRFDFKICPNTKALNRKNHSEYKKKKIIKINFTFSVLAPIYAVLKKLIGIKISI